MKEFLTKTLLFLLPLIILGLTEAFVLPLNLFTFRCWEALKFIQLPNSIGLFYPNQELVMDEEGDLGYYTKYAVKKHVRWKTDKIGYRNDQFIGDPDILFIGDSFVAGNSLSQEETVTNEVASKLGPSVKVYNIATADFPKFVHLLDIGLLKKPRLVVFSRSELSMSSLEKYTSQGGRTIDASILLTNDIVSAVVSRIDRFSRFYSLRWMVARLKGQARQFMRENLSSLAKHNMLIVPNLASDVSNNQGLEKTVRAIASYKAFCDSLNIGFLFLPMPSKETVYFDYVPYDHQPRFLFRLDSLLTIAGIPAVNTLRIYNLERAKGVMLYQNDDSHWNGTASHLIAAEIANHESIVSVLAKRVR